MNKEMENTINQQLLPCPFCGGKPVIRKSRRFIPARFDKSVIIRCSVCDTKTAGLQLNKAVASWNKRTERDLFKTRNLGKKGAEEVLQVYREYGRL